MNQIGHENDPEGFLLFLFEYWVQFGIDAREEKDAKPLQPIQYDLLDSKSEIKIRLKMLQYIIHEMTMEGAGLNKRDPSAPAILASHEQAINKPAEKIRSVMKDDFPHLADFQRMNLMPFCVENLKQVRRLKIRMNGGDQLPPFMHLFSHLECLTIEDYEGGEIPDTILQMGSLRKLSLISWKGLLEVGHSIRSLCSLERISFSRCNNLWRISPVLRNFESLKHVDLSSTAFECIPNGVLWNRSIENLVMNYCFHLRSIDPYIARMPNLRVLSLRGGKFRAMPFIQNLQELDLYGSKNIVCICNRMALRKLDLRETNVVISSDNPWPFPDIEYLAISNPKQQFPAAFSMPKLRVFHLENYCGPDLPSFIYNCGNLENIFLSNCYGFATINAKIYNLKRLDRLELIGCALRHLDVGISALQTLKFLTVINCRNFVALPPDLCALKSLEKLILTCTAIAEVPASVLNMRSLRLVINRDGEYVLDVEAEERAKKFVAVLMNLTETN